MFNEDYVDLLGDDTENFANSVLNGIRARFNGKNYEVWRATVMAALKSEMDDDLLEEDAMESVFHDWGAEDFKGPGSKNILSKAV